MTTPVHIQTDSWPQGSPDSSSRYPNFTDEHFSTANLQDTQKGTSSYLVPSTAPQATLNNTSSYLVPSTAPQATLNSTSSYLVPSTAPQATLNSTSSFLVPSTAPQATLNSTLTSLVPSTIPQATLNSTPTTLVPSTAPQATLNSTSGTLVPSTAPQGTLNSTSSYLVPSTAPQATLNSSLTSLVPSTAPQATLNSTLTSLVSNTIPHLPSCSVSMQADCDVVRSLLDEGSEAWENQTDQLTVVFEVDDEVDINGNLSQFQGLSNTMVSSSNDLQKCIPSLSETDFEPALILDADMDSNVWNFIDDFEKQEVSPFKHSPVKSPIKLEQETVKVTLQETFKKSLEISDKVKQKRKYIRQGKMSSSSRTRNLIIQSQLQCKCPASVVRDEVPVDQVFVRDGQMYRLPEANVIRIGNFELYAFMKDNDCFISLALFLRDVGSTVAKWFERTIIDYLGDIEIQETGDNEKELLRQKCQVNALTKVTDLISLADIRTLSKVILKIENQNDIVKSLANDTIYCKSLGSSALKCSACGYECRAAPVNVEYEPIEMVYLETDTQIPEVTNTVPQTATLILAGTESAQDTRTVCTPENLQEMSANAEETVTMSANAGETLETSQYRLVIVEGSENIEEDGICLETYHAGTFKVNRYCFSGFKFEDKTYISLKELVRMDVFTVKKLQWALTKLSLTPVSLPEELEEHFSSNWLVSNTLWIDVVDVRCCLCLKICKRKPVAKIKDMVKSFCAGCYSFTPTTSVCCKRLNTENRKFAINAKSLKLCASTEGRVCFDNSAFAFNIVSDGCQIRLRKKDFTGDRGEYETDRFSPEIQTKESKVVASLADTTTDMHAASSCRNDVASGEVTAACRRLETIISQDISMQDTLPSSTNFNKNIHTPSDSKGCLKTSRIETESLDSSETKSDSEKISDNFDSVPKPAIQPGKIVEVDEQTVQTQDIGLESLMTLLRPGKYILADREQLKDQLSESEMIMVEQILNSLDNNNGTSGEEQVVQGFVCELETKVEPCVHKDNHKEVTYKLDDTRTDTLHQLKHVNTSSGESQMRNNGMNVTKETNISGDICRFTADTGDLKGSEMLELSGPKRSQNNVGGVISNDTKCDNRSNESDPSIQEGYNSFVPVINRKCGVDSGSEKEDLNGESVIKSESVQSPGPEHSSTQTLTLSLPLTTIAPYANSLDPDETPSNSASHPDPSCLTQSLSVASKSSEKGRNTIVSEVLKDMVSKINDSEKTENNDSSVNEQVIKPDHEDFSDLVHSPVSLASAGHFLNTSSDLDLPTTSTPIASRHSGSPGSHGMASRVNRWYTKIAPLNKSNSADMSLHMLATIATADAEGNCDTDSEMSDTGTSVGSNHHASAKGFFQPPVFINLTEEKQRMLLAEKINLEDNIKKFLVFKMSKSSPPKFSAVRFKPGAEKVFPELFYPDPGHPQVARKRRQFMSAAARYMEHQMTLHCWELKSSSRSSDSSTDRKVSDSESASTTPAQGKHVKENNENQKKTGVLGSTPSRRTCRHPCELVYCSVREHDQRAEEVDSIGSACKCRYPDRIETAPQKQESEGVRKGVLSISSTNRRLSLSESSEVVKQRQDDDKDGGSLGRSASIQGSRNVDKEDSCAGEDKQLEKQRVSLPRSPKPRKPCCCCTSGKSDDTSSSSDTKRGCKRKRSDSSARIHTSDTGIRKNKVEKKRARVEDKIVLKTLEIKLHRVKVP